MVSYEQGGTLVSWMQRGIRDLIHLNQIDAYPQRKQAFKTHASFSPQKSKSGLDYVQILSGRPEGYIMEKCHW